jgi:hypothetical protein
LCIFVRFINFLKDKEKTIVSDLLHRLNIRLLDSVAGELIWLNHLLTCFEIIISYAVLFCDNPSIIHLVSSPTFHERSKCIDIDLHFIQDRVSSDEVPTSADRITHRASSSCSVSALSLLPPKLRILNAHFPPILDEVFRINVCDCINLFDYCYASY